MTGQKPSSSAPKSIHRADGRLDAPTFHRNSAPMLEFISYALPINALNVLEVASGTGQHICNWSRIRPQTTFWPTDLLPDHLTSINAWRAQMNTPNVKPADYLDITSPDWVSSNQQSPDAFDAIVGMNILHISPWAVSESLFERACQHLKSHGFLAIYGPFKKGGNHTADSNALFDQTLRQRNAEWGVRDIDDLDALARENSLKPETPRLMPANNMVLIYRKF